MFISATRLRLRSALHLPAFAWYTYRSKAQAGRAPGFVTGKMLVDRRLTFWTLTGWDTEAAMRAYRGAGAHGEVMPKLANWCDEASVAHWQMDGNQLPDWLEAHRRIAAEGRSSKVNHPSPDHLAKRIPAPRTNPPIGNRILKR